MVRNLSKPPSINLARRIELGFPMGPSSNRESTSSVISLTCFIKVSGCLFASIWPASVKNPWRTGAVTRGSGAVGGGGRRSKKRVNQSTAPRLPPSKTCDDGDDDMTLATNATIFLKKVDQREVESVRHGRFKRTQCSYSMGRPRRALPLFGLRIDQTFRILRFCP